MEIEWYDSVWLYLNKNVIINDSWAFIALGSVPGDDAFETIIPLYSRPIYFRLSSHYRAPAVLLLQMHKKTFLREREPSGVSTLHHVTLHDPVCGGGYNLSPKLRSL